MKKIMTYVSFVVLLYAIIGAMAGLGYLMSDVLGWTWYINLCNGLTYSQLVSKALSTPWMEAVWAIELFVGIPFLGWLYGHMWLEAKSKRATEN